MPDNYVVTNPQNYITKNENAAWDEYRKAQYEKSRDTPQRYGSYVASRSPEAAYQDQLLAAMEKQQGAAEGLYAGANRPGELQAQAQRGAMLRQNLGGLGLGGLAAVRAMQGTGQDAFDIGTQASREGLAARQQAGQQLMGAQAQRANIEQAMFENQLAKQQAYEQAQERVNAARDAEEKAAAEQERKIIGAASSALSAGLVSW